jgi:hypothetical protein
MGPPELQLINRIWNGSKSKPGCIAWFAAGTGGWGPLAERTAPEFSYPEICKEGMPARACTHTAFCVGKLLSAKLTDDKKISFDLSWSDELKEPIASHQLQTTFSQVNKVFLVRVNLDDDTGHSFVLTSYQNRAETVCCGLYMSYAASAVGGCGYSLPEFLKGNLEFAPKEDRDIHMSSFIATFAKLFDNDVASAWRTLFKCGPEKPTSQLKQVLVKVLDRTVPQEEDFLQKLGTQWPHCPHGDDL